MPRTDHGFVGIYNPSDITLNPGEGAALAIDINARVKTAEQFAPTSENNSDGFNATQQQLLSVSTGAASVAQNNSFTTLNLKATAGRLYGFVVINTTASVRYLQFFNTATTPSGGGTATLKFQIAANGDRVIGADVLGVNGIWFSTGIAYGNSSTASTYTAGSAGDLLLDVFYK